MSAASRGSLVVAGRDPQRKDLTPTSEPNTCDVIKGMIRTELTIMLTITDKAKAERKRAEIIAGEQQLLAGSDTTHLLHHREVRHAAMSWLAQHKDRIDQAMWSFHVEHAERDQDIRAHADVLRRFVEGLSESARQDCLRARDEIHAASLPTTSSETPAEAFLAAVLRPPTSSESAEEFLDLLREWWAHARLFGKRVRPWYNLGQFLAGLVLIPISFFLWMAAEIRCAIVRILDG